MIDRYSITVPAAHLNERFSVEVPDFYQARYNAAPTQLLPVITSSASAGLSSFYWGTSPEWSKNKVLSEKIINIRMETLQEKPAVKRAMMRARCIVPADGFYVWKKVGKKTAIPYRIVLTNRDVFSFAAIWEEFEDTEGNQIQTFTIITTEANDLVKTLHERMPVILTRENEQVWLNDSSTEEELLRALIPYESSHLSYYPVSPGINSTDKDLASLIIPSPPADQHGNLTLFD